MPPLAPVALAMAAGVIIDRFVDPWGSRAWAFAALVAATGALLVGRRRMVQVPLMLASFLAIGAGWHHWRWADLDPDDLARVVTEEPRPGWVRGFVRTVPEHRAGLLADDRPGDEGFTRFELEIEEVNDGRGWSPASGRASVLVGGECPSIEMGLPIEAAGSIGLLEGPLNPGERDPREYPWSRGVRLRLSIDGPEGLVIDPGRAPQYWRLWLGRVRASSDRRLSALLGGGTGPLASALLLGRRGGIDEATSEAFSRTGTMHLLAISGLHLSAVAAVVGLLAIVIGFDHKAAARLVLVVTIAYATLVGWSPSVCRASAMVAAICLAAILDRPSGRANAITLAAIASMIVNPSYPFSVGWQLSFLAVSVLILGVPPLLRWVERKAIEPDPDGDPLDLLERKLEPGWKQSARRLALWPVLGLVASSAVWLATMPLIAWRFNMVSPIGVLLNVPLIPVVGASVVAGGLAMVASAVWMPLGMPAAWACDRLLRLALAIVGWAESIPGGYSYVPTPPSGWLLGLYLAFAVAARASAARWPKELRRVAWLGVGLVGLLGTIATITPDRPESFEVESLAVGHGLATVIRGPDGSASLYDCGRTSDPSVGRRIAAPALWARGVRRIESVILSHADADHYNGLPDLFDRFAVGSIVVPDGYDESGNPGVKAVLDRARSRGIPIREVASGDRVEVVPGLVARVLHPARGWLPDASDNDRSLVLDLEMDGRHLLLTGDLDGAGLAEVIFGPRFPIDAMMAPHHGGRSANPPWLYDWSEPGAVVVSQRHPRPGSSDALSSLPDRGIVVRRTWDEGAIPIRWRSSWVAEEGYRPKIGEGQTRRGPKVRAAFGPAGPSEATRWVAAVVGLLVGAWICGAVVVIHWAAWSLVLPGKAQVEDEPFTESWESVSIASADGLSLRAWRRLPDSAPDARVAVVLHGLAEASPSMKGRGEALAGLGWTVLLPDLRSFGRSEGDRATYGAREADDVRRWIDHLTAGHPAAPPILVWGRSMGASIALRAAAEDSRIRSLILEVPYADLRRALEARLSRLPIPGAALLAGLVLSRASRIAGTRIEVPRPIDLAPRVSAPTLILQGGADVVAPISEVRRLARSFPGDRRPEVASIPDAGHAEVFERGGPELVDRIRAFLDRAGLHTDGSNAPG